MFSRSSTLVLVALALVSLSTSLAEAQTITKRLQLFGTSFPTPYDVVLQPPYNPMPSNIPWVISNTHAGLFGVDLIPDEVEILEIRFVGISSGTFTPGAVLAGMRPLIGGTASYFQVVGGAVGPMGLPPDGQALEIYGNNQYGPGGDGVFPINPFTNQQWTKADLLTLQVGWMVKWLKGTGSEEVPQRFSINGFWVDVDYRPLPKLTVDASNVARGGVVTFSVTADASAVVSDWAFSGANLTTISRSTNVNGKTWSGAIVAPGSASVRVVQNGQTYDLTAPVAVTPRNWTWTPVTQTRVFNNSIEVLPSPPFLGSKLGVSQLEQRFTFSPATIVSDQGPNHGVRYTTSISNVSSAGSTRFRYELSTDLMSNNSAFYKAQCGNYNAQTGTGFIRGTVLRTNIQEHEFGTVLGHYQQYSAALLVPADNIGQIAESRATNMDLSDAEFNQNLLNALNSAASRVDQATTFEACNRFGEYDTSCAYRGKVNFSPYASCK